MVAFVLFGCYETQDLSVKLFISQGTTGEGISHLLTKINLKFPKGKKKVNYRKTQTHLVSSQFCVLLLTQCGTCQAG